MHDSPVIPYLHLLHETLQSFKYLLYGNIRLSVLHSMNSCPTPLYRWDNQINSSLIV